MEYVRIKSLADLNDGAVDELFQHEFVKLLNNLQDENTSWKEPRQVTIQITVKPNSETRESCTSSIKVTSKLAGIKPHESSLLLDYDGSGVTAHAYKKPVQQELDNITEFKKEANGD